MSDKLGVIILLAVFLGGGGAIGLYAYHQYNIALSNEINKRENGEEKQAYVVDKDIKKKVEERIVPMYSDSGSDGEGENKTYTVRLLMDEKNRYVKVTKGVLDELPDNEYITVKDYTTKVELLTDETKQIVGETTHLIEDGIVVGKHTFTSPKQITRYYLDIYVLKTDYRVRVSNETYNKYLETDKIKVEITDDGAKILDI